MILLPSPGACKSQMLGDKNQLYLQEINGDKPEEKKIEKKEQKEQKEEEKIHIFKKRAFQSKYIKKRQNLSSVEQHRNQGIYRSRIPQTFQRLPEKLL